MHLFVPGTRFTPPFEHHPRERSRTMLSTAVGLTKTALVLGFILLAVLFVANKLHVA